MVDRGFLERQRRDGNRKIIHLRLTEAAAPVIRYGRAVQRRYGQLLLAEFTEEERRELFRLLEKLGKNVESALSAGAER